MLLRVDLEFLQKREKVGVDKVPAQTQAWAGGVSSVPKKRKKRSPQELRPAGKEKNIKQ